jgi:hypothetical protein
MMTTEFSYLLDLAQSGMNASDLMVQINYDLGRDMVPDLSRRIRPDLYMGFSTKNQLLDFIGGNERFWVAQFGVGVFATPNKSLASLYAGVGGLMSFSLHRSSKIIKDINASHKLQDLIESFIEIGHDKPDVTSIYNTFKVTGLNAIVFGYDAVELGDGNVLVLNKKSMVVCKDFSYIAEMVMFEDFLLESESFNDYPQAASDIAKKAIKWKEDHGKEVKGGTGVGWARAGQLANREPLSLKTLKRIKSFFDRHQKNKKVSTEHKGEPWKDNGAVAWALWGGDPMYTWVKRKLKSLEK